MRNFYTMNTVEAPNWCKKCGQETQWRISGGQPQYCLICMAKPLPVKEAEPEKQRGLWDEGWG